MDNSRLALAKLGSAFFGNPFKNHTMIGITGTNGKTTTAHMIRHLLEYAKLSCSLFGTIECYINGESYPSTMTTHDAIQIQRWLHESKDENVVMEVSSHSLVQHRVGGILFDYAIFTNLTHEHLDYHSTMLEYFKAKERLFSLLKNGGEAIVNTTSRWGKQLKENLVHKGIPVSTVGEAEEDTFQLIHVESLTHPVISFREEGELHSLQLPLPGIYNVWNALSAVALARRKGISYETISEAMGSSFPGVPGRFQRFRHPNGALAVIDYAHTPDGLHQCLSTVSSFSPRRLIHIFGFRGGKDNSKWEEMLKASNTYADETVLTLDDLNGVALETMNEWYQRLRNKKTTVILDRTKAIAYALERSGEGDFIVVTGKGPEPYKESFSLPSISDIETLTLLSE